MRHDVDTTANRHPFTLSSGAKVKTVNVTQRQNTTTTVWMRNGFDGCFAVGFASQIFRSFCFCFTLRCVLMLTSSTTFGMCNKFWWLVAVYTSIVEIHQIIKIVRSFTPFTSSSKREWPKFYAWCVGYYGSNLIMEGTGNEQALADWPRYFCHVQFEGIVRLECDGKNVWN